MALVPPYVGEPREVARSDGPIESIGWTTEGTALFSTRRERGKRAEVFRVTAEGPERIWAGSTEDRYGNPGRALRVNGNRGPWLERGGRLLLASDGLGPEGPEPYLEAVDLRSFERKRLSPEQARRFFHALAGNGVSIRYVELPYEGHHYWARESVLHIAAEMLDWLQRMLRPLAE